MLGTELVRGRGTRTTTGTRRQIRATPDKKSAAAALAALRRHKPSTLVLAASACARETRDRLREAAEDVVCVISPDHVGAVGTWYANLAQTTDDDVMQLLLDAATGARRTQCASRSAKSPSMRI